MAELELYVPRLEELSFRQQMMADPDTMFYNANWDVDYDGYHRDTGCIDFPEENWADWYDAWVASPEDRFYAYIRRCSDGAWLGEVNVYYNEDNDWWDMGIVLYAPYRGQGYATQALRLLVNHAFRVMRANRIHNDFELARNEISAWQTHRAVGFRDTGTENGFLHMMLTRQMYMLCQPDALEIRRGLRKGLWPLVILGALVLIAFAVFQWATAPITLDAALIDRIDFAAPWTHKADFLANGFELDVDKENDILLTYRASDEILVSIRAFPGAANDPDYPVQQMNGSFDNEKGNTRFTYGFDLFKNDAGFATFFVDADSKADALLKIESLIESLYTKYRIE